MSAENIVAVIGVLALVVRVVWQLRREKRREAEWDPESQYSPAGAQIVRRLREQQAAEKQP